MRVQDLFIIEDAQQLNEINMSPRSLRQLASTINAKAGMEFEMIVPDIETDSEPDMEPDWGQDQRSRSFRDVRDFFHDGDYNGRREVDNLMENLESEFFDWQAEQIDEAWNSEGREYLRDMITLNGEFDEDSAKEVAAKEVANANPDLPPETEDFEKVVNTRVNEMLDNFVEEAWDSRGRLYDRAYDQYQDEMRDDYNDEEFLRDNYSHMTDIQNSFDIQWPYYYDANEDSGSMDIDSVADDFSNAIGKPINASSSYHGARREAGKYVVEPDGSLEGDNPGDKGLEFVSPPMPINELLADLAAVKEWADRTGCYTNDSTGLHINVSVPALEGGMDKLDYVKLALLLGDERVLNEFGRAGNTYCKSAMKIVKERVISKPDEAAALLNQMKGHLDDMASKAIHTGQTNKFTSINTKTGYIEFRSPGGDWLNSNFEMIEPTLLRFVVALDAATDPEKYRQEYLTKLYKVLAPKSKDDTITHFAKFAAGELPKQALKSFVRQAQLERKVNKGETSGQKMWWNVAANGQRIEVVATDKQSALEIAAKEWGMPLSVLVSGLGAQVKPLRPYEEKPAPPATTSQGNWGIWMTSADRFAREPGQIDNNVLRRFPSREAAEQFIAQTRAERPDMRTDIEVREIEPSTPIPGSTLDLQRQRAAQSDNAEPNVAQNVPATAPRTLTVPGQRQQQWTGQWLLKDAAGTVLYRFGGIGNSQHDANVVARGWLQNHPNVIAGGVEVVPEME